MVFRDELKALWTGKEALKRTTRCTIEWMIEHLRKSHPMSRIVSATDAKSSFGSLLDWAGETGDPVIVERRGRPVGVILSFEAFEDMREQQEHLRREQAWEKWRQLEKRLAKRPPELTEEEAERIAEQAGRDMMESLIRKGKVRFEE
jgi:prevent-host-death family protein